MGNITKFLKALALVVGLIAGVLSIVDFFLTDRAVTNTVQRFFAPTINLEQNLSPDAIRELRKNTPDGEPIRIEKGITIREETNGQN